jgi:hypothetical protein
MLRQTGKHFQIAVPVFRPAESRLSACEVRLSNIASAILTPCQATGRLPTRALCEKFRRWLKSLKTFSFRAIVFHAVWQ